jgi:hypothetical protein
MRKKKSAPEESVVDETPAESFVDRTPVESPSVSGRKSKLSLKLDSEGKILWDEVSESQKEQFAATVANDATALEMIGLASPADGGDGIIAGDPTEITNENIKMVLDSLQWVQSIVFTKMLKIDSDIAKQVCVFTEEQHTELDPRGARIANKRAPEFVKKFQDEIFFCGMLAFYMSMQLQNAKELQNQRIIEVKRKDAIAKNGKANGAAIGDGA